MIIFCLTTRFAVKDKIEYRGEGLDKLAERPPVTKDNVLEVDDQTDQVLLDALNRGGDYDFDFYDDGSKDFDYVKKSAKTGKVDDSD